MAFLAMLSSGGTLNNNKNKNNNYYKSIYKYGNQTRNDLFFLIIYIQNGIFKGATTVQCSQKSLFCENEILRKCRNMLYLKDNWHKY